MYEYSCKIVKVIDGDTVDVDIDLGFELWLKKQRIRLYGVDTPESRTRDLVEKKYGLAAKAFVQKFLPVGSKQVLRTELDDRGKFGRILGHFVIDIERKGKAAVSSTINEWTEDQIPPLVTKDSNKTNTKLNIANKGPKIL